MAYLNKHCVIFHIKEVKGLDPTCLFSVKFEFDKKEITDLNNIYKLKREYFPKMKDKMRTYIYLNIGEIKMKFLITLYYDENHITIIKSKKIGVTYEIINQISYDEDKFPLEQIYFKDNDNNDIIVKDSDNIGNKFRKRFLVVNAPIKNDLSINFDKLKNNLSYKVVVLPKSKTLVYEIKEPEKIEKINLDLEQFKLIQNKIENVLKKENEEEITYISNELKKYNKYFDQVLINKEDFDWIFEEFQAFYYYLIFQLLYKSKNETNDRLIKYYQDSLSIFSYNYKVIMLTFEISNYDKVLAIKSLYIMICYDSLSNKNYLIGKYDFMALYKIKYDSYKYAFKFLNDIVDNLTEDSFIFYPLLQLNSGKNIDLNFEDNKNEIFEISMLNVEMIKSHLKSLIPKFIFRVDHPSHKKTRGATEKNTGIIYIYDSNIFHNNLGYSIEDYMIKRAKDSAVNLSFTLFHEIFMHKKFISDDEVIEGKESPVKFIGPKFDIKTFFYTNKKDNWNNLAIYTKNEKKLNTIPDKVESGRIFEYFFEIQDEIIKNLVHILKTYIGLGDLIDKVNLVVSRNADELLNFIKQKICDEIAKPLLNNDLLNKKRERDELKDNTIINFSDNDREEEEENEGEEDDDESETSSLNDDQKFIFNQVVK